MLTPRLSVALVFALALFAAVPADAQDLKQAEAEADRLDPGWRFDEIQARRAKLPAEKNGALIVLQLLRSLPEEWGEIDTTPRRAAPHEEPSTAQEAWDALMAAIADDPTRPIPPKVVAALKDHDARLAPVLARARDLENYSTGYTPLEDARNPLEIKLPVTQDSRKVVRALSYEGHARAARGDVDGALASAREILGVSRALGDEPFAVSQVVRMAFEAVAVELIERALARGQATDAALAATQAALASEASEPLLLYAMRGERAVSYELSDRLATGKLDIKELAGENLKLPLAGGKEIAFFRGEQAILLHRLNQAVAFARKPLSEQPALFDRWEEDVKKARPTPVKIAMGNMQGTLASILLPAFGVVSQAHMRTRAILRAEETMVGLERVRLATGRWPKPGDSLAPAFKVVPPDPFTGKPMLWKLSPTGLVVYSVGFDRGDHGGKLENVKVKLPGTDIGVRLWDVDRRPKMAR